MLDPRTNTTLEEMADALRRFESFAICGHVNPDGDCLGSALALAWALRECGKHVDVLLVEDAPVEPGLWFLPGLEGLVPAGDYDGTPDAFIAVDVSAAKRIGLCNDVMERCGFSFIIDHHGDPDLKPDLMYNDPDAASCSMLIWELAKLLGALTPKVALCAYTGLMTDTGRFQFQNTDVRAFEAAAQMVAAGAEPSVAAREFFQNRSVASLALQQRLIQRMEVLHGGQCAFSYITLADFAECQAVAADAESLIDTLRSVRGIRVACLMKERNGLVRGSFRAKDDVTDVAELAARLEGGGHKAAAGFTLEMPLPDAIARVKAEIAELFGD